MKKRVSTKPHYSVTPVIVSSLSEHRHLGVLIQLLNQLVAVHDSSLNQPVVAHGSNLLSTAIRRPILAVLPPYPSTKEQELHIQQRMSFVSSSVPQATVFWAGYHELPSYLSYYKPIVPTNYSVASVRAEILDRFCGSTHALMLDDDVQLVSTPFFGCALNAASKNELASFLYSAMSSESAYVSLPFVDAYNARGYDDWSLQILPAPELEENDFIPLSKWHCHFWASEQKLPRILNGMETLKGDTRFFGSTAGVWNISSLREHRVLDLWKSALFANGQRSYDACGSLVLSLRAKTALALGIGALHLSPSTETLSEWNTVRDLGLIQDLSLRYVDTK